MHEVDHGVTAGQVPTEFRVGDANANRPHQILSRFKISSTRLLKASAYRYKAFCGLQNTPICISGWGFASDSFVGAHVVPPDCIVGWGEDTPPHTLLLAFTMLPPEFQPDLRFSYLYRLITLIWSHTCQFVISFNTAVTIHYSFSLRLQTQNSSFPQIFSSIVLLPFHPPHWLHGLQVFFVFLGHVGFNFGIVC